METDLFFVPGGPGLNSEPERQIIGHHLKNSGFKCTFWNEPSKNRPSGYPFSQSNGYTHWLNSLENSVMDSKPRLLIGVSFGGVGILDLLQRQPIDFVEQFLMIGPTLDMGLAFKKMMEISANDMAIENPGLSSSLQHNLTETKSFWDQPMQEGLSQAWQNPSLLSHYFYDPKYLKRWLKAHETPEYQIDGESQKVVLDDMAQTPVQRQKKTTRPLTILYGKKDPVFNRPVVERLASEVFTAIETKMYERSGHFPHIEETDRFIEDIRRLLGS